MSQAGKNDRKPGDTDAKGSGKEGKHKISSLFGRDDALATFDSAAVKKRRSAKHNDVILTGDTFADFGLNTRLVDHLTKHMQLSSVTLPQKLSIPYLAKRHDVMIKSPTGTGKTLAYAIPIVNDLQGLQHKVMPKLRCVCVILFLGDS